MTKHYDPAAEGRAAMWEDFAIDKATTLRNLTEALALAVGKTGDAKAYIAELLTDAICDHSDMWSTAHRVISKVDYVHLATAVTMDEEVVALVDQIVDDLGIK